MRMGLAISKKFYNLLVSCMKHHVPLLVNKNSDLMQDQICQVNNSLNMTLKKRVSDNR
jgi:hypothetical protein